ncbi:MAG: hypothetical protein FGM15_12745, partial [Chthoniobacterales bacterium]|nr:hypothetical protein [Chthoniobacterales bacterium]
MSTTTDPLRPTVLRCNTLRNPSGVDDAWPELSWAWEGNGKAIRWRCAVSGTRQALEKGKYDVWDSGWMEIREGKALPCSVRYAGPALESRKEYHWKILVDVAGSGERASEAAFWTMGLAEGDWQATWVGKDAATEYPAHPFLGAQWIWDSSGAPGERCFERKVLLEKGGECRVWGLADDAAELEVDGVPICRLDPAQANFNLFTIPNAITFGPLEAGEHVFRIRATKRHDRDPHGGVIASFDLAGRRVVTDAEWKVFSGDAQTAIGAHVVGPFGIEPWHLQSPAEYPNLSARYLRKEFTVPDDVERAVVYYSGLGLSRLWFNGVEASDDELSPAATDYHRLAYYRTIDVTGLIKPGANAVGCVLGNGRYFAPRVRVPIPMETYGCPKLLLQLELHRKNGTIERIVSGPDWSLNDKGAIGWNNEFDGEWFDARLDDPAWTRPGFDASSWEKALPVGAPPGVLRSQPINPIRVTARFEPVRKWKTKFGTTMLDFGQNLVGRCRVRLRGRAGTTVQIRHAEGLDSDDLLALDNLRSALCTDHVTLREGETTYAPSFTYHGFRYAEVRGADEVVEAVAEFVHDDVGTTAGFRCSEPLINRIVEAAAMGIRGNYRSFPCDCPQRDERMGWLGDRAMGASGEMFLFDVQAFYRKWAHDIMLAQSADGCVPDIAPPFWRMYNDNVTWPTCVAAIPYYLHMHYGDSRIVEEAYPAISKWLLRMAKYVTPEGLVGRDIYGDWCVPPEEAHIIVSTSPDRQADKALLSSAYLVRNMEIAAEFADLLGRKEDAADWRARRARMIDAINARFLDATSGRYGNGTQTSQLLPLAFGIAPKEKAKDVFDRLVERVMVDGRPEIATGLIGIQWLFRTLTAHGRADLATALALREDYPSWGHMIKHGATTIWELWNGNTADPLMNSGNHVMLLGDFLPWIFCDV